MKIDVAYCVELEKVVDIHLACQQFAAQNTVTKFHFLCSDPVCRHSKKGGVRVSGVNHSISPEEKQLCNSPHFRKWDEHHVDCDWMELAAALKDDDSSTNAPYSSDKHRKLSHKIKRLITCFVVPGNGDVSAQDEIKNELDRIRQDKNRSSRRKKLLAYARGAGSTATSLEALVSCYEELKAEDVLDEEFTIKGHGTTSFRNAFRQIMLGATDDFAVYYGGARLYKRYGDGFALNFMDKLQEQPASFYVSSDQLKNHRPGARLKRIVDVLERNKDRRPYLRVYWIGGLEKTDRGDKANFTTLAHVVFRLVYPLSNP